MKIIKCLIVDDEELARDLLANFVQKFAQLEIVAKCESPISAHPYLTSHDIDLLFLDIQMPEMTGIEFLKSLRKRPVVILTTAYPNHAIEGYQLDVTDYLLKPYSFDRFAQAVNKALEWIEIKGQRDQYSYGINAKDYILVNSEHKIIKIRYNDIIYIEGMREYVAYHTTNQGRIMTLISLKKLDEVLPDHFLRIHKSYIANTNFATALEANLLHLSDQKLPIGASYKEQVHQAIF